MVPSRFPARFQKPLSVATGIPAAGTGLRSSFLPSIGPNASSATCPTCGGAGAPGSTTNVDAAPTFAPSEMLSAQLTTVLSDGLPSAPMASSIYNIELDSIEDKPWRQPGSDITDYFNYGFDEQTWRLYCLRQKSQREEAHQSRRIGVSCRPKLSASHRIPAPSTISPPSAEYYFGEESKSPQSTRRHRSRSRSRGDSRKTERRSETRRSDHESKDRPDHRAGDKASSASSSYSRSNFSRTFSSSSSSNSSRKPSSSYRS
ncbi:hypothetical protein DI09_4p250 [Mitosporidium daphniae]|uniref:Pre-mRNA polyadenylation factor Fip1 domain-containing protein n=1 Tax=Mitosporidium daphniae TaxID=1485682 RepID=A0A098VPG7_9MICR|nr:uncharacterized protein DI09_4p250 [Mitosporidium daphniae]KGG50942.1 hypothetical protein DI09_4p250 [Mitosporidium daphniae]|eukprot:XP_013237369.1 uncharacterized protein DI09_4p250 [Mitosporidium daphniae]